MLAGYWADIGWALHRRVAPGEQFLLLTKMAEGQSANTKSERTKDHERS